MDGPCFRGRELCSTFQKWECLHKLEFFSVGDLPIFVCVIKKSLIFSQYGLMVFILHFGLKCNTTLYIFYFEIVQTDHWELFLSAPFVYTFVIFLKTLLSFLKFFEHFFFPHPTKMLSVHFPSFPSQFQNHQFFHGALVPFIVK